MFGMEGRGGDVANLMQMEGGLHWHEQIHQKITSN